MSCRPAPRARYKLTAPSPRATTASMGSARQAVAPASIAKNTRENVLVFTLRIVMAFSSKHKSLAVGAIAQAGKHPVSYNRSEERRVGKECRDRRSQYE